MAQNSNRGEKPSGAEGIGESTGRTVGRVIDAMADAATTVAKAAMGAAVGSVAGGIAGFAKAIQPAQEDQYWRQNYRSRSYIRPGATYEEYQGAYRFGWEARGRYPSRTFEAVESELHQEWIDTNNPMAWDAARDAAREAWNRVEYASANQNG